MLIINKMGDNMNISVSKIKDDSSILNKLIGEYENIYLNFYNQVSQLEYYWQSNSSKNILPNIIEKKQKIKLLVDNLDELNQVYLYMVKKYSDLGNNIIFYKEKKSKLYLKIDNSIDKLNYLISLYNNISIKNSNNELLINQKQKLINCLKKINNLKKEILNILNYIEETENKISLQINKINIELIKDNDNINCF